MKESNELNAFLGRFANGILSDAADGELNPVKDFTKYIPSLLAAQPGFAGLGEWKNEQAVATVQDKQASLAILTSEINGGKPEDNYDIAHFIHGVQGLFSLAFRNGKEEGERELKAKLKSGELTIADL